MDDRGFKFSLLFGIVTCFLPGLVSSPVLKTPTTQLRRIVGDSALLHVNITAANTVSIVKWIFHPRKGEANDLGRFSDENWNRWNMSDSFGQRLETVDGLTLNISNLVLKDSGVYKAHVTFSTGVTETHTFDLTVYEPVLEPQITPELISITPDGCNVTLHCQASGQGVSHVSWKRGDPPRALDESPDCYQLSDNGAVLHLFWHRNASDANITCLVSNPVDQKNISVNLLSLCPAEGANVPLYRIQIICGSVAAILVLVFLIAAGFIWWKWETLKSKFQKVFCHRNSTPNATELQEVVASQSTSLQNRYAECPQSESDKISDSTPPPHGPLENC